MNTKELPRNKAKYQVMGEIYNVRADLEENGLDLACYGAPDAGKGWWEYKIWLLDAKGRIIGEWDSLRETYNGMVGQRLTKADAKKGLKDGLKELEENRKYGDWFRLA